jgi:hypothetical protein
LTSSILAGKLLDWNFRRHAKKIGMEISKWRQQDLENFPIEQARLEIAIPLNIAA